ncbi:hypothetical protein A33I_17250 [Alkalihalophilus marmarensis DSM 21297]|uniref:Uncharacterized protein n=1 Tax=Alkalihalophilus marmarensis DSM 21297 TaxID=1188261 RepID=U6SKJ5_9BACI|nr:hypothetical protein A33I_17250 [Alkalihalophilus marmarensis DSM 21297]
MELYKIAEAKGNFSEYAKDLIRKDNHCEKKKKDIKVESKVYDVPRTKPKLMVYCQTE